MLRGNGSLGGGGGDGGVTCCSVVIAFWRTILVGYSTNFLACS
jgi:hypothetical protein